MMVDSTSYSSLKFTVSEHAYPTETEMEYDSYLQAYQSFKENVFPNRTFSYSEVLHLLDTVWSRLEKYKNNETFILARLVEIEEDLAEKDEKLMESHAKKEEIKTKYDLLNESYLKTVKKLDASYYREQDNQEMIASLMNQAASLRTQIEKKNKEEEELMRQLGVTGLRELKIEKEKMNLDVKAMRNEIIHLNSINEDQEMELRKVTELLTEEKNKRYDLSVKTSDLTREIGVLRKETMSSEDLIHKFKKFLIIMKTHYDAMNLKYETLTEDYHQHKENAFRIILENETLQKEITASARETERVNERIADALKKSELVRKAYKDKDFDLQRLKMKMIKNDSILKREITALQKLLKKKEDCKQLMTIATAESPHKVNRDKTKTSPQYQIMMLSTYLLKASYLAQETKKKLENEIALRKGILGEGDHLKKLLIHELLKNQNLISEKDRLKNETSKLQEKIEEGLLDVKDKESIITELKKELEKKNFAWKKVAHLYEEGKKEKRILSDALKNVKENNKELKMKAKIVYKMSEQLEEAVVKKNYELLKGERTMKKKNNEIVKLDFRMAKTKANLINAKKQISKLEKEEYSRKKQITTIDEDKRALAKQLSKLIIENSMILSQLDRKSSSISAVKNKLQTMESILKKGSSQYNQRLDDIRIMRLEILKLRREKNILLKAFENMTDMRSEVYNLYKDLLEEKMKNRALEDEMKTPINYHRWRILEGTDPEKLDLLEKIKILQKKVYHLSSQLATKQEMVKDLKNLNASMKLNLNLVTGVESQKMCTLKHEVNTKTKTLVTLSAELASYECDRYEMKAYYESKLREQDQYKKKYFELKLKDDRRRIGRPQSCTPKKSDQDVSMNISGFEGLPITVTPLINK